MINSHFSWVIRWNATNVTISLTIGSIVVKVDAFSLLRSTTNPYLFSVCLNSLADWVSFLSHLHNLAEIKLFCSNIFHKCRMSKFSMFEVIYLFVSVLETQFEQSANAFSKTRVKIIPQSCIH